MINKMDGFICTRATTLKQNADKDFVSISYTSHKKKRTSDNNRLDASTKDLDASNRSTFKNIQGVSDPKALKKQQDIQMKRARFDVIKLGMSGLDGENGFEAKAALAIKLGAKPPKRKGKNYKELLLEKRAMKTQAAEERSNFGVVKNRVNKSTRKRRDKQSDLSSVYGKVDKRKKATITNNKK